MVDIVGYYVDYSYGDFKMQYIQPISITKVEEAAPVLYTAEFDFETNNLKTSDNQQLPVGEAGEDIHKGDLAGKTISQGDITISFNNVIATPSRYFYTSSKGMTLNMYKGATMVIAAPEGKAITKIDFTYQAGSSAGFTANPAGTMSDFDADEHTFSWEGNSQAVACTFTGARYIYDILVTYTKADAETTLPEYEVTFVNGQNWENVYAYAWSTQENEDGEAVATAIAAWPGQAMTAVNEQVDGYDVYGYKFQTALAMDSIIFNNNDGIQTENLVFTAGKQYTETVPVKQTFTATFTTNAGWDEVYAYAWTTEGETTTEFLGAWPGTKIEATEGVYTVTIEAVEAPANIIFNNGGNGAQTENLAFENGKAYEYTISDEWAALIAAAEALVDNEAVAVGKLIAAINVAKGQTGTDEDKEALKAAEDQFVSDNADQESDQTAKVATNGWKKYDGTAAGVCSTNFAPAITTYDGRTNVQLAEVYEGSTDGVNRTGTIIYQDITGLTNGTYKVGFYGNAFYTSGRGFDTPRSLRARGRAYRPRASCGPRL